jgi:hypothetical protein
MIAQFPQRLAPCGGEGIVPTNAPVGFIDENTKITLSAKLSENFIGEIALLLPFFEVGFEITRHHAMKGIDEEGMLRVHWMGHRNSSARGCVCR